MPQQRPSLWHGRGPETEAMPQTACATTATATSTLAPRSHPACDTSPIAPIPYPNIVIASAEGSVNPIHPASIPSGPARNSPIAIPESAKTPAPA